MSGVRTSDRTEIVEGCGEKGKHIIFLWLMGKKDKHIIFFWLMGKDYVTFCETLEMGVGSFPLVNFFMISGTG